MKTTTDKEFQALLDECNQATRRVSSGAHVSFDLQQSGMRMMGTYNVEREMGSWGEMRLGRRELTIEQLLFPIKKLLRKRGRFLKLFRLQFLRSVGGMATLVGFCESQFSRDGWETSFGNDELVLERKKEKITFRSYGTFSDGTGLCCAVALFHFRQELLRE